MPRLRTRPDWPALLVVAVQLGWMAPLLAQASVSVSPADSLPNAPSAATTQASQPNASVAPRFSKYIDPGQQAMRLSAGDKAVIGIKNAFAPAAVVVWALVGGYEQLADSTPNFPTNKAGYFRRAGCEAARDASDNIFADSIFAPIYHQDPRYYLAGRQHGFLYRTFYAASRTLVTRTDGGHLAPNASLISGTIFGSLLSNVYYPTINQGVTQTAETFGGSMGSSAIGFVVVEFGGDILEALHLKHSQ